MNSVSNRNILFSSICSLWNPFIIRESKNFSIVSILFQSLFFLFILSIAFGTLIHKSLLLPNFQEVFHQITPEESVQIANGKASFDESIKFPHIRRFDFREQHAFRYILDDGESVDILQSKFSDFLMLTPDKVYLQSRGRLYEVAYENLNSRLLERFFGKDPMVVSGPNLAHSCAQLGTLSLILFAPPFLPIPLTLGLMVLFLISSLCISISLTIINNKLSFLDSYKFSLFSVSVPVIIQTLACIFFTGKTLVIFFMVGWIIQLIYLITATKDYQSDQNPV